VRVAVWLNGNSKLNELGASEDKQRSARKLLVILMESPMDRPSVKQSRRTLARRLHRFRSWFLHACIPAEHCMALTSLIVQASHPLGRARAGRQGAPSTHRQTPASWPPSIQRMGLSNSRMIPKDGVPKSRERRAIASASES